MTPEFNAEYQQSIDQIAAAARKLRAVAESDEDSGSDFTDDETPYVRMSAGAFCLKAAYRVWSDLLNRQMHKEMPGGGGMPMGQLAGIIGPIPLQQGRRKSKTAGPEQPAGPEQLAEVMMATMMTGMSPDEVDRLSKMYRQFVESQENDQGEDK